MGQFPKICTGITALTKIGGGIFSEKLNIMPLGVPIDSNGSLGREKCR